MNEVGFFKVFFALIGGVLSVFAPIQSLIILVFVFVLIDFITGIWASHKRAYRRSKCKAKQDGVEWSRKLIEWEFSSERMRNTAYKCAFYIAGVMGTFMIQSEVLYFIPMQLEKVFAGFILGVEFFSFLENAADITNHPIFRWLQRFARKELKDKAGIDIPEKETKK